MKRFLITKQDDNQRLGRFLEKMLPSLYPSLMHKYLRTKRIKLNGRRAESSARLNEGDLLELYIPDEFFEEGKKQPDFLRAGRQLTILYEDENIAVLYKPAGVLSHDDKENNPDTLIHRFLRHLCETGAYDPDAPESFTPALCNRLDRGTAGIVIAAKNLIALREMNGIIKDRRIKKSYLAAVIAKPPKDGRYTAYLCKDSDRNIVAVSDKPAADAKKIITGLRLAAAKNGLFLLDVDLVTGRTHQIRAHLRHLGCPILGDGKYGSGAVNRRFGVTRQALAAYKIAFHLEGASLVRLAYLDQKEFLLKDVWFVSAFFS